MHGAQRRLVPMVFYSLTWPEREIWMSVRWENMILVHETLSTQRRPWTRTNCYMFEVQNPGGLRVKTLAD